MSILKKIVLLLLAITVFSCAKERSPLHQAIVKQNLEKVTLLVESGADIEELDYIRTPLMRAVSSQNLEIVKYLISQKANVHYVNKFGHTMLHVAAMSKNPKIFEYILSFNLDINRLDKRGGSILNRAMKYVALQGKGVENLKLVLSQKDGAKHINLIKNGYTPLMVACENKEVVKLLIQYGADVTIKNKRGDTALSILLKTICRNETGQVIKCSKLHYNPKADKELLALLKGEQQEMPQVNNSNIVEIEGHRWEHKKGVNRYKDVSFDEAKKYCQNLNLDGLAFRLPTLEEIDSLSSQEKTTGFVLNGIKEYYFDPKKVTDLHASDYWFINAYGEGSSYDFIDKRIKENNGKNWAFVKCIVKN